MDDQRQNVGNISERDETPAEALENRDDGPAYTEGATEEQARFCEEMVAKKIARKKNSTLAAILAHCHECLGHYSDGMVDCENRKCPLYTHMPFRKLEPDFTWCEFNPRRVGKQREVYNYDAAQRAKERFSKKEVSHED